MVTSRQLEAFLDEDIGQGDITTEAVIPQGVQVEAVIVAKASGILAGVSEASEIFRITNCKVKLLKKNGEHVRKGERILQVTGDASAILTRERVALNIIMRMSGIATLTGKFVETSKKIDPKVTIACTRKTAPGLRRLDKKAVQLGGGDTHRLRLDDCVLIKDNHLRIVGSVEKAVWLARKSVSFTKKIEVEVSNLLEAKQAVNAGADLIMLDNLSPQQARKIVRELTAKKLRDKVTIEASGGINLDNVAEFARTGVDVLSVGALTHSAKAMDVSLEILNVSR
jgi:nicotinate-nucleotide pyrophosphorylase (carboxylating)